MYVLDADFNVLCLQHKLFPVSEWDAAICSYVQQGAGHLQQKAFQTLGEVVKRCLYSQKLFTHEMIPNVVALFQQVVLKNDQHSEMLKWYVGDVFEQLKG